MNIKIILTSYLLTFMYGDRVFQDSLLLSREVLKKAYQEGLYYISSSKNIQSIIENPQKKRNLLVFAGIPSFQEACVDLSPNEVLHALKIKLPYEVLAGFSYQEEKERSLVKKNVSLEGVPLEPVFLKYYHQNGHLYYEEVKSKETSLSFSEEEKLQIIHGFKNEVESYRYAIINKLDFLREQFVEFLKSSKSIPLLENEEMLQDMKESYEELIEVKR